MVENAIKYGHQARLSVEVTDPEILIHVDDSGPGIPKEFREDVFRPFSGLKRPRNRESGGSGLGLTVARSVARAHGGDVIFAVSPDGGFRVTVALPQPKPKPLPQTATGAVTQAPTKTLASAQSERQ